MAGQLVGAVQLENAPTYTDRAERCAEQGGSEDRGGEGVFVEGAYGVDKGEVDL